MYIRHCCTEELRLTVQMRRLLWVLKVNRSDITINQEENKCLNTHISLYKNIMYHLLFLKLYTIGRRGLCGSINQVRIL